MQPDYAAALRRYEALARRDDATIHARGGTILLGHGRPTERAVVLLHGLTASPSQCAELARRLHERGDTVLVPRLPGHGARDRLTTQLRDVRADELTEAAHESLAIAPFLGVARLHPRATPAFTAALRALPNVFLWWNPILRERLLPDHGYPRFPTRALAEALGVANALTAQARLSPPAARRITIVTNTSETSVNNAAAHALAAAWHAHGTAQIELAHIRGLPPSHDVIEPLRPGTHAHHAYRTLLPILEGARERT